MVSKICYFSMDSELDKALNDFVAETDSNKSKVIRRAVKEFLDKKKVEVVN